MRQGSRRKKPGENILNQPVLSTDALIVCLDLGDGGAQRVVSTLANCWSQEGRKVCVVTLTDKEEPYQLHPSIQRIRIRNFTSQKDLRRSWGWIAAKLKHGKIIEYAGIYKFLFHQVKGLRRVVKQIDSHTVLAFAVFANIITILACLGTGKRVIISERNDPARQHLRHPWGRLRRLLYNQADVVTANSHGALLTMEAYVDKQKLAFVPNPLVRCETTAPPSTGCAVIPYVLTVGRLHEQKGHDVLFKAFSRLSPEFANWRLAVVGRGELKEALQSQAADLGISERVDWYGQVRDPFFYYRAAKIFVLSSRYEGMPNALLEAMSCGLPVIVSDASPGPLELVKNSETGLVVSADDPAPLARALELLAGDDVLRQRLGEAARKCVSDYDIPKALAAWEQIIGFYQHRQLAELQS